MIGGRIGGRICGSIDGWIINYMTREVSYRPYNWKGR